MIPHEGQKTVSIGDQEIPLERDMNSANPTKTYFLSIIPKLLEVLPETEIFHLKDVNFCKSKLSTSYPVLTDDSSKVFDSKRRQRYYRNKVNGSYYVCNDWYDKRNKNNLAK